MSHKIFETPPTLRGTHEQRIGQLYGYLFRLSENLNVALNTLTKDNFISAGEYAAASGISNKTPSQSGGIELSGSYNELRALIVNTANIVHSEMDKLERALKKDYTAISDEWGEYKESITSTIEATAEAIIQRYGYDAEIETLKEQAAGFSAYKISTEGYIKQGFIDYDENNVPILGIAIGQNLVSTKVTVEGEEYEKIDETQNCAFYTASKLSFRVNGDEVAWLSNSKLYIHDVEIKGSVILNDDWMITTSDGFKIRWIGEVE